MHRPKTPVRILFTLCARGDEPAWHEFLARFGPTVERAVTRVLGRNLGRSEVEDQTQNVYCALLDRDGHRLRAFRGQTDAAASGFLARTAERLACDRARFEIRRGRIPWSRAWLVPLLGDDGVMDPGPGPEAITLGHEQRRLVSAGCRRVLQEPLAARLVELALFEGWASRELAGACRGRYSQGAINTLLSRARKRLVPRGLLLPHRPGLRSVSRRADA